MKRKKMLKILDDAGDNAGSDFNDGDDVMGYFGWSVRDGILTVTFDDNAGTVVEREWLLREYSSNKKPDVLLKPNPTWIPNLEK